MERVLRECPAARIRPFYRDALSRRGEIYSITLSHACLQRPGREQYRDSNPEPGDVIANTFAENLRKLQLRTCSRHFTEHRHSVTLCTEYQYVSGGSSNSSGGNK